MTGEVSGWIRIGRACFPRALHAFPGSCLPDMVPDYVTPSGLEVIETEAFADTAATFVWLTDDVTAIGSGAFDGCDGMRFIRIPSMCQSIGTEAFPGDVTLLVEWNSERLEYATQNNYDYLIYTEGFNG